MILGHFWYGFRQFSGMIWYFLGGSYAKLVLGGADSPPFCCC